VVLPPLCTADGLAAQFVQVGYPAAGGRLGGVLAVDQGDDEFFSELTRASRDQVTGRSVLRGRAGMGPENGCERRGC
jgi:hypothetical protein